MATTYLRKRVGIKQSADGTGNDSAATRHCSGRGNRERNTPCIRARWRCGLTISERVRLCPECRAEGYHCIFFQIQNLYSCPVHGSRLIDYCTNCGANTRAYDLQGSRRVLRSDCRECHGEIFLSVSLGRADSPLTADRLETLMKPLVDWIGQAERTHRLDPLWHARIPLADLTQPYLPPGFDSSRRFTFSIFA